MIPNHYSLDLETLGVGKRSIVLSLGICQIDLEARRGVSGRLLRLDVDEQLRDGRTVSASTLDWWSERPITYQWARGLLPPGEAPAGLDYPISTAVIGSYNLDTMTMEPLSVAEAVSWLTDYLSSTGGDEAPCRVWVRGPQFDAALVEDMCEQAGLRCPVRYNAWRDVRTLESVFPPDTLESLSVDHSPGLPHDALSDALAQAGQVADMVSRLAPPEV